MNLLDIDFQSLKNPIIDAFTFVYGEIYRDIIRKQINNTCFISYFDVEGIESYASYLKICKERELSLRFLDKIGVSSCYDRSNYSRAFDGATIQVLDSTIDSSFAFSKSRDLWSPLWAFDENNHRSEKILQENRLKIINYLLQEKGVQLSLDELNSFIESDEYPEIYEKIERYRNVYRDLLKEYSDWQKSLSSYLEFVTTENDRRDSISRRKKQELFFSIYPLLPKAVKDAICDKDWMEQEKIVLGTEGIDSPTLIESFSKKQMNRLAGSTFDSLVGLSEIRYAHIVYFNQFGIALPFGDLYDCNTKEKVSSYLEFLKQERIQQYIPNQDAISLVEKIRKKKENEAYLEYLSNRSDYQKINMEFHHFPEFVSLIRNIIKEKTVCVTGPYGVDKQGNVNPFLCFAIRRGQAGFLDYLLLHESGHAIDKNENGCGMEPDYTFNNNSWRNPYDKDFRIYEKFNETLNDIFAIEALEYLHKNDIYLLESKEIVQLDCQDQNTHMITKRILFPLLEKFREEVIAAKVNVNPLILTQCIGEDNYETLVDIVNKVDYLCRNGLEYLLKYNPDSTMCKDYQEQLERASEVYSAIDTYYDSNHKENNSKQTSKSKKS